MQEQKKTYQQFVSELAALRRRFADRELTNAQLEDLIAQREDRPVEINEQLD